MPALICFKAYDVRGIVGQDFTPDIAFSIGRAFAQTLSATRVVIGRECRPSSPALLQATANGLMAGGADVLDLGLCGTEEVYHATSHFDADGGIEITARPRGAGPASGRFIRPFELGHVFRIRRVEIPASFEEQHFRPGFGQHISRHAAPGTRSDDDGVENRRGFFELKKIH